MVTEINLISFNELHWKSSELILTSYQCSNGNQFLNLCYRNEHPTSQCYGVQLLNYKTRPKCIRKWFYMYHTIKFIQLTIYDNISFRNIIHCHMVTISDLKKNCPDNEYKKTEGINSILKRNDRKLQLSEKCFTRTN